MLPMAAAGQQRPGAAHFPGMVRAPGAAGFPVGGGGGNSARALNKGPSNPAATQRAASTELPAAMRRPNAGGAVMRRPLIGMSSAGAAAPAAGRAAGVPASREAANGGASGGSSARTTGRTAGTSPGATVSSGRRLSPTQRSATGASQASPMLASSYAPAATSSHSHVPPSFHGGLSQATSPAGASAPSAASRSGPLSQRSAHQFSTSPASSSSNTGVSGAAASASGLSGADARSLFGTSSASGAAGGGGAVREPRHSGAQSSSPGPQSAGQRRPSGSATQLATSARSHIGRRASPVQSPSATSSGRLRTVGGGSHVQPPQDGQERVRRISRAAGATGGSSHTAAAGGVASAQASMPASLAASPEPSFMDASFTRDRSILDDSNLQLRTPMNDSFVSTAPTASQTRQAPEPKQVEEHNVVTEFFEKGARDSSFATSVLTGSRMDVTLYYEKRRIQNLLRRVYETMQERFSLESVATQACNLGSVYDRLSQAVGLPPMNSRLEEVRLGDALDVYTLWPPELSGNDRAEVFATLTAPTAAVVKGIVSRHAARQCPDRAAFQEGFARLPFNLPDFPVPTHLLSSAMQPLSADRPSGFTPEQTKNVADTVATVFAVEQTGLGRLRDFFLTGLVSLEEIQGALPRLVHYRLVQAAVVKIIRAGAPYLKGDEWQDLVFNVRTKEACGHSPEVQDVAHEVSELRSQASISWLTNALSPVSQQRDAISLNTSQADLGDVVAGSGAAANGDACNQSWLSQAASEHLGFLGHHHQPASRAPVTEPLPTREVRNETPVLSFYTGQTNPEDWLGRRASSMEPEAEPAARSSPAAESRGEPRGGGLISWGGGVAAASTSPAIGQSTSTRSVLSNSSTSRVVDWSSVTDGTGAPRSVGSNHSADAGAGARLTWGTSQFKREVAAAMGKAAAEQAAQNGNMPDPVAWMDLELHQMECGGPYLARAFERCCQLYLEDRCRSGKSSDGY
eukprot:TRINITY_DN10699_c0_g1_i1.p1 TRINITY_DN10699_c0_g1~~TRINITY_DN10699_c0_g1_i1.p1  ORF type:complete len:972 (+),score=185.23 TRINITY_DN10699_c0_g1_i1:110-3025(+)